LRSRRTPTRTPPLPPPAPTSRIPSPDSRPHRLPPSALRSPAEDPGKGCSPSTPHTREELVVVSEVVRFIEEVRDHGQTDRPGGEVVDLPPDQRRHIQPIVGPVEAEFLPPAPVVHGHGEASRHRNEDLVERPVRVTAPRGS